MTIDFKHHASRYSQLSFLKAIVLLWLRRCYLGVVAFVLVVLIVLHKLYGIAGPLNNRVIDLFAPVVSYTSYFIDATIDKTHAIANVFNLKTENAVLKQENRLLKRNYRFFKQIEQENLQLRKLLNFIQDHKFNKFVTARIIAAASGPYARTAMIDIGSKHDIKKGQVAVNHLGLVGRIINVSSKTAQILLVTDFNSKIPVFTVESRQSAIMVGNNADGAKIIYLPRAQEVKVGELVVTSGDAEIFPADIIVGTISAVEGDRVLVSTAVRWHQLDYVSILQ
jgi:rod shape-determining protein MreC